MGVKIVGTANNHSMDAGIPGMLETIRLLDQAGIAHAGTGRTFRKLATPPCWKRLRALLSLVDYYGIDPYSNPALSRESGATYANGGRQGNPGVNGLHLTPYFTVLGNRWTNCGRFAMPSIRAAAKCLLPYLL